MLTVIFHKGCQPASLYMNSYQSAFHITITCDMVGTDIYPLPKKRLFSRRIFPCLKGGMWEFFPEKYGIFCCPSSPYIPRPLEITTETLIFFPFRYSTVRTHFWGCWKTQETKHPSKHPLHENFHLLKPKSWRFGSQSKWFPGFSNISGVSRVEIKQIRGLSGMSRIWYWISTRIRTCTNI